MSNTAIKLTESELHEMIKTAIMEFYDLGDYDQARPNSNELIEMVDDGLLDSKEVLVGLIGYMDDDRVGEFMKANGYVRPEDEPDESEEEIGVENNPYITERQIMGKQVKLTREELHRLIKEAITEVEPWTYFSAADKSDELRKENPNCKAHQWNRVDQLRSAGADALLKKYGLEGQWDGERGPNGYSSQGTINVRPDSEFPVTGSREYDFGDRDEHGLGHNVYHMSKEYGEGEGYGRTRMWDSSHETTPEEFFGSPEIAAKFRAIEKEMDDWRKGNIQYKQGEGWVNSNEGDGVISEDMKKCAVKLTEKELHEMIKEAISGIDNIEGDPFDPENPSAKGFQNDMSWNEYDGDSWEDRCRRSVQDAEKRHFETPIDGKPNSWDNMAYDELTNVRDDNGQMGMMAQDDSNPEMQRLAQAKRDTLHNSRDAEFPSLEDRIMEAIDRLLK